MAKMPYQLRQQSDQGHDASEFCLAEPYQYLIVTMRCACQTVNLHSVITEVRVFYIGA